jgi:hypothetical protein
VNITFDANGVITDIVGSSSPLSADMRRCLLDLFTTYCYPTLAGMTRTFPTCHSWIA